jgi:curved DNA-binding protein CbpA
MQENYYKILGVPPSAAMSEIREAYWNIAKANHPDLNPSGEDIMAAAAEAYGILSNDKKRIRYDSLLDFTLTKCPECSGRGTTLRVTGFSKTGAHTEKCKACNGEGYGNKG